MNLVDKFRLTGKTAFVTGGARGIGKAVSEGFAQAGANIVIADLDDAEAQKTAKYISEEYKVKSIAVKTDVTSPESVNNLIDVIDQEFGRLDIAFCNAGICINAEADKMTFEQWSKVININLTGVFLTAQAAGKYMIKKGIKG